MNNLWKNYEKWEYRSKEENCPVCLNHPQPENDIDIVEMPSGYLCATSDVPFKGTCYLITRKHYIELFDMSDDEAFLFMKDIMKAAKAIKEVTGAIKINYEIHGNTVPHLHIVLYPRYLKGDRFSDGPINPRLTSPPAYQGNEFFEFIEKMRFKLKTID